MVIEFYVSPAGNDDWTGKRPEPTEDGTGPFRTVDRAQAAVRETITDGMAEDVVVNLASGNYYRDAPLQFDTRDAGRTGHAVIYRNRPGESPAIVGGQPISGWEPVEEGIYAADVGDWSFFTLFEDDQRCRPARFPTEGYAEVVAPVEATPTAAFYVDEEVAAVLEGTDPADLQVSIWPGGPGGERSWFNDVIDVERYDPDDRTIHLAEEARYELGAGSRYALQGVRGLLDTPGEFALDRAAGRVYYKPRSDPIEQREIVAPTDRRTIVFAGDSRHEPIANVHFDGVDVRISDRTPQVGGGFEDDTNCGLIHLENARDVEIRNAHVAGAGLHGILLDEGTRDVTIAGNEIGDIGHTGVQLRTPRLARECHTTNNRIHDNHIHHVGRTVGHGAGILVSNCADTAITHNRIHHTTRYAISLKAFRPRAFLGEVDALDGIKLTEETVREFTHTKRNVIAYNDVSHANLDSQDTGVIESWGAGPGNVIDLNRIHDSQIPFSFGFGLYLDDAADEFTVTNNVIHDLNKDGDGTLRHPIMSKGIGNRFRNNVIADNDASAVLGTMTMGGEPNRDLVVHHNVFCESGDDVYGFNNWNDDRFRYADYNLVYNTSDEYGVDGVPWHFADDSGHPLSVDTFADWQAIARYAFDESSVVDEPRFVDPASGDYRLAHDSPGRALGIHSIPIPMIGLTADYPHRDSDDPITRLYAHPPNHPERAFLELSPGEEARVATTARTETGYLVLESDYAIDLDVADTDVATVAEGGIKAVAPGVTTATITLTGHAGVVAKLAVVIE